MRLALFSSILVGTRIRLALTLFDWAATGPRFHVLLIPSSQTLNGLKDEEGKQKDLLTRYDSLHCRKTCPKEAIVKVGQISGRWTSDEAEKDQGPANRVGFSRKMEVQRFQGRLESSPHDENSNGRRSPCARACPGCLGHAPGRDGLLKAPLILLLQQSQRQ